jgi:hypothetical protein
MFGSINSTCSKETNLKILGPRVILIAHERGKKNIPCVMINLCTSIKYCTLMSNMKSESNDLIGFRLDVFSTYNY